MADRTQKNHHSKRRHRLSSEYLEPRLMLDADGVIWGADARLTMSFAPDGTSVAGTPSTLFAQMDALAPRHEWQSEILRGFQTWAKETNGDVGLVADDSSDFGTTGQLRRDSRFGDVRIGSIPLDDELFAVSVSTSEVIDGTWVGEVLFNSNKTFASVDEVFAVALHEAGHVFGLEHTEEKTSPMHSHESPTSLPPTANDLANLHAVYGLRSPDIYDLNNEPEGGGITELELFRTVAGNDGTAPSVAFADIMDVPDTDEYSFEPPDNYAGSVTIELVASGISHLAPTVVVTTENGTPLGSITSSVPGTDIQLTINDIQGYEKYHISVDGAADNEYAVGGYTLLVWFDAINEVDPTTIGEFIRHPIRHVESDELRDYFREGQVFYANNDDGSDDLPGFEIELKTTPGFADGSRYQHFATLETIDDVDRYSITTPNIFNGSSTLGRFSLRSIDPNLAADIVILDDESQELSTTTLIHNDGSTVLQSGPLMPDHTYFIEIRVADYSGVTSGNYELLAQLGLAPVERTELTSNSLTARHDVDRHRLNVFRPQLFHFDLSVQQAQPGVRLQMVVTDKQGNHFATIESDAGDTRTASVFLPAGAYRITVRSQTRVPFMNLGYSINATTVDDPLGPRSTDTTTTAFDFEDERELLQVVVVFVAV